MIHLALLILALIVIYRAGIFLLSLAAWFLSETCPFLRDAIGALYLNWHLRRNGYR